MTVSKSGQAPGTSPWWEAGRHADRRPFLLGRAKVAAALRQVFAAEGFIEVETPILQVSPGNETHLHAFATMLKAAGGASVPRYLRTSPEFTAKKLLAAGEEKIFEFARSFRNEEHGPAHHPEFTMLEWYRVGASIDVLMDDCALLLAKAAKAGGTPTFRYREQACDPFAEPERLSLIAAFRRLAGIDLDRFLPDPGRPAEVVPFAAAAQASGIRTAADDTWGDVFSRVLVARIEPELGKGRPTILCDYPVEQAALARPKPCDPRVAERFELYACGLELANAFGELTDPVEQRRRLEMEMAEKLRLYGETYPIDADFLAALADMPPASGCALGFDRLAMLATGARRIEDVLWAPVSPAEPG